MSSFFKPSSAVDNPLTGVKEYVDRLSAINYRSLVIESLQIACRHIAHESYIVSEQVNALLAKRAGIQIRINSLSKRANFYVSFWMQVLQNHQFLRSSLLISLHNIYHYHAKLSLLDEMKLSLVQEGENERCFVDNFIFKLRKITQSQLTLANITVDAHVKERLYQDVTSMEKLIGDYPEFAENSREFILRGIRLVQSQLSFTLNYRDFLAHMATQYQQGLYRVDWCIEHIRLELRKAHVNCGKQQMLLTPMQSQLSLYTQQSDKALQHLLSLFRERTQLNDKITRLKQQQEKDRQSLRAYQQMHDEGLGVRHFFTINQLIAIQDVLINTPKIANLTGKQLNEKLQKMFDIAVGYHAPIMTQEAIKKGYENHVTRLITNEFSFYTRKPLTLDEYQQVLKTIELLAKTLPPNVQLILSSFAVVDIKQRLANVVLHVSGGKEVVIHQGVKSFPANSDPDYGLTQLSAKTHQDIPYRMAMKRVNSSMPVIFNFSHLLLSETQGGAQFLTSLEICLDVGYQCGERCLIDALEKSQGYHYPLQYSHVISSHIHPPLSLSANIPKLVQADKKYFGRWFLSHDYQIIPSSAMKRYRKVPLANGHYAMLYHYPFTPAGLIPKKYRLQMTGCLTAKFEVDSPGRARETSLNVDGEGSFNSTGESSLYLGSK